MSSKTRYRPRIKSSKHTNLCTQQRRLRHVTCIIGRNIDPSLIPVTRHTSKCSLLSLYFTIHAEDDIYSILYKSEIIEDTLNPNWREFDSQIFSQNQDYNKLSSVIVCIWGARRSNDYRIILRYNVHFSGLVYCREQLRSNDQSYEINCLLFRIFGGYYTWKSVVSTQEETYLRSEESVLYHHIKVDQDQLHLSYKKASLLRAHFTLKAIYQTRQQVIEVKKKMQEHLSHNEVRRSKFSAREALIFKNSLLKQELERLKQKLLSEEKLSTSQCEAVVNREKDLSKRQDELEQYISEMKVCHSAHIERRETLLKISAHLNFRRRQLAAELSYIYPILELPLKDGNKREYAICGVRLPNSEEFLGEDETMLAVAIGNVGHLVYMMAKFMELPLRYPIRPMGSKSTVVDLVTDKLTDKQREFPLYSKGKEKFQFHYGVFLLNKNIAQLRYHNGIGTADLRNTLPNLKHLLEAKYGVRVIIKSASQQSGFNKSAIIATRAISLPATSSPIDKHSTNPISYHAVDGIGGTSPVEPMERPRSEVMTSGLPSVHVRAQQQHRFISKKGSIKKPRKSVPETESSDLIAVSFEDLMQKTIDGTLTSTNQISTEQGTNGSAIDPAEDCLKDQEDSYVNVRESLIENSENRRASYSTQFSVTDALIIPDPFEREPDDTPFSPGDAPFPPSGTNMLV